MSRWPEVALSEVLTQQRREEAVLPERDYRLLGAHWYAKGLYVKDEKSGTEIRGSKLYRVEAGDFVYNRLFAWKGSFAVASKDVDGCYVSNEFPCFTVDAERLASRYLWLYFSREAAWNEALGLSFGATPTSRNRLKEANLLAMRMPLPSVGEQRRVVEKLNRPATRSASLESLHGQVDSDVRALYACAQRRVLERFSGGASVPLGDAILDLENGWSPACLPYPAERGSWGVIKLGAVSFGRYDPAQNKQLPDALAPRPQYEIRAGDVLISRANTRELVGSCVEVEQTPPRLMLCDKVFRVHFRPDGVILPTYLNLVLKTPGLRQQIEAAASGTSPTMQNISKRSLMALAIPLPLLDDQRAFVKTLTEAERLAAALRDRLLEVERERAALLRALLVAAFERGLPGGQPELGGDTGWPSTTGGERPGDIE